MTDANQKLDSINEQGSLLKEEVTEEDIAEIVSRWTGIPVDRMLEGEREKLLHMEDSLKASSRTAQPQARPDNPLPTVYHRPQRRASSPTLGRKP